MIAAAPAAYGAETPRKPFIESGKEELVRAVPELTGIEFDPNQDGLDGLLDAAGENLASMFAKIVESRPPKKSMRCVSKTAWP